MSEQNNPFSNCNTDAEIMKMVFELSATKKYSRQQLNIMASFRREEIKEKVKANTLSIEKVVVPSTGYESEGLNSGFVVFSQNFKNSSTFEFLGSGKVKF